MGKLIVVVGGQYGSEGKGAVVAHLAQTERVPVLGVRVGGSNAGHTAYDTAGQRWPLRHVPVPMLYGQEGLIAAGSEVDLEVLRAEIGALRAGGVFNEWVPLSIDPQATLVESEHQAEEQAASRADLVARIGSTGKGVGAARAARAMRRARLVSEAEWQAREPVMVDGSQHIVNWLDEGGTVIIEGTQGYGLGLHAGWYPKCTSADCRAIDFLSQAGVSPWGSGVDIFEVWVVLRTQPIRVAGESGPLFEETSWGALGLEPEQTTVTHKTRRVGGWDHSLALAALKANGARPHRALSDDPGPVRVALTMFDYWMPDTAGETLLYPRAEARIETLEELLGVPIDLVGTGPVTMVDRRGAE